MDPEAQDQEVFAEPNEFGSLTIKHQELAQIPSRIFELFPHALLRLDLQHNNLLELPEGIGQLILLREINVSNNRIQRIDPAVGRCIRLRTLNLSNNYVASIPPQLTSCCRMLERLDVSNNRLTSLPDNLSSLPSLSELRFDQNQLTRIPKGLHTIPTLQTISCHGNEGLSHIIHGDVQTNSGIILSLLKIHDDYNDKIDTAKTQRGDFTAKADDAAQKENVLDDKLEEIKKEVEVLKAERPDQYLARKRKFLALKSKMGRRSRKAKVSTEAQMLTQS